MRPKERRDTGQTDLLRLEALMLVAEHGGDTMLSRIGIVRALYPNEEAPAPRRKAAKKYRLVR